MFITPSNFEQFTNSSKSGEPIKYLINWRNVTKRMPWGVILLVGGGFSLAEGTIVSEHYYKMHFFFIGLIFFTFNQRLIIMNDRKERLLTLLR